MSTNRDAWFGNAVKDLFGAKADLLRYKAMKYGKFAGLKLFLRDIRPGRTDFPGRRYNNRNFAFISFAIVRGLSISSGGVCPH